MNQKHSIHHNQTTELSIYYMLYREGTSKGMSIGCAIIHAMVLSDYDILYRVWEHNSA